MDPRQRRVSEIMQTEVATLAPGERLDLADDVMSLGRVRHMPVLDGARLVGLVSQFDVMAASLTKVVEFETDHRRTFMRSIQVHEVMARDVVSVAPDASLAEAAERMLSHRIHCLPVTEPDGTLVGLVTDTDLLRAGFLSGGESDERVQDVEEETVSDLGSGGGFDVFLAGAARADPSRCCRGEGRLGAPGEEVERGRGQGEVRGPRAPARRRRGRPEPPRRDSPGLREDPQGPLGRLARIARRGMVDVQ